MKVETKTQLRAICPACFKQHAVQPRADGIGTLVDHGYQIPQEWHQRVGSCYGVGKPHFGTEEGRKVTEGIVASIRSFIESLKEELKKAPALKTFRIDDRWSPTPKKIDVTPADGYTFEEALKRHIYSIESRIRNNQSAAKNLQEYVSSWKPVSPVEVQVETGPTIHMYWERSREKVLCVYSSMSGRYTHRHSTKNEAEVNCSGCLKALASMKKDAETKAKAEQLVELMVARFGAAVRERFSDAGRQAVSEIRYRMKDVEKEVRQRACRIIER